MARTAPVVPTLTLGRDSAEADTPTTPATNTPSAATVEVSADADPDFTDEFCAFLQRCVTNVDGAELLLQLKKNPDVVFDLRDLVARLAPTRVAESEVARHIATFEHSGVIERDGERVRYRAGSAAEAQVDTLARLYIERPVTLFRVIYALRDTKIKTFSDAFKLR